MPSSSVIYRTSIIEENVALFRFVSWFK
uniref:Uncharacterized protein n=1 Tax=Rhizophora mucronata TaxID=61149 RepID=A0A2P2R132_RHIMU